MNKQLEKLRRTQLAIERSITGTRLADKIKSNKIGERMVTKDIRYIIKKLKLKYAGHVERSTGNQWESTGKEKYCIGLRMAKGLGEEGGQKYDGTKR